jgi:hypothetical protein
MVNKSTVLAIVLGVAGASVATVAAVKPDLLKIGAPKGKDGTTSSGTSTPNKELPGEDLIFGPGQEPPVIIGGGGGSESVPPPSAVPPPGGSAPGGGGSPPPPAGSGGATQPPPSGTEDTTIVVPPPEEPFVTTTTRAGKVVKLSAETGLALSAGTPIAKGVVERVKQMKEDKELSLIVTAAFEPLGKETTATSVRGTPLAKQAIARTTPTLAGILTTTSQGARAIRGSPELFKRLEANLLASTSRSTSGGAVVVEPKPNQVLGSKAPITKETVSCGAGTVLRTVDGVPTCILVASKNIQDRAVRQTQRARR